MVIGRLCFLDGRSGGKKSPFILDYMYNDLKKTCFSEAILIQISKLSSSICQKLFLSAELKLPIVTDSFNESGHKHCKWVSHMCRVYSPNALGWPTKQDQEKVFFSPVILILLLDEMFNRFCYFITVGLIYAVIFSP